MCVAGEFERLFRIIAKTVQPLQARRLRVFGARSGDARGGSHLHPRGPGVCGCSGVGAPGRG